MLARVLACVCLYAALVRRIRFGLANGACMCWHEQASWAVPPTSPLRFLSTVHGELNNVRCSYSLCMISARAPCSSPAPCACVSVCRYNEKADVYSYGILVWFVAQYLHLCYNPHIWCNRKDFTDMMRPYSKGT
jgi:hypothetical protein